MALCRWVPRTYVRLGHVGTLRTLAETAVEGGLEELTQEDEKIDDV